MFRTSFDKRIVPKVLYQHLGPPDISHTHPFMQRVQFLFQSRLFYACRLSALLSRLTPSAFLSSARIEANLLAFLISGPFQ
jgi:hypothetical protein